MPFDTPILIVDESSSMRTAVRQILKEAGYKEVILSRDGAEGLKVLKGSMNPCSQKIGLILCEWAMPNMTGLEMLQEVRKDSQLKTIPFVMVTNEKRTERILDAVKKGATDFIFKPFPAALLVEKVKKHLLPSS